MKTYDAMTLSELDDAIAQSNAVVDKIKQDLRDMQRARDAQLAAELTAKRVASMSPAEREAMAKALAAS